MKSKIYIILLLTLCLQSCTASCESRMRTWVGCGESDLISSWGAPDSSITAANGKKIHTWKRNWGEHGENLGRQSFTIAKNGTIISFSYSNMPLF